MEAILELQRQLKAVQQQKPKSLHHLNDRNAVDIIRRLLEAKMISLIFTQDGKEYLTHEQLRHEIVSLVKDECNGRMALLDMPHHLGVDYDVVLQKV